MSLPPLQVPPTMRFVMDGKMPEWLQAKDLILQIIGEISVQGECLGYKMCSGWVLMLEGASNERC